MTTHWGEEARRRLLSLRRGAGVWSYGPSTAPATEPTALAGLALRETDPEAARAAASWLAAAQSRDGSVGVSQDLAEMGWPTPYACLLWAAVARHRSEREAAVVWLLGTKGRGEPRVKHNPIGHDTTLIGWPWISGTHSWVEPTAMALLALGREGRRDHPRAQEGLAVIRDRSIPTGGWNMGNPVVLGATLRPQPAPTALALLAMSGSKLDATPAVQRAIRYLRSVLSETRAPASLSWGVLGLRAWGAAPASAEAWLRLAFHHAVRRGGSAMDMALLLLAADCGSLDVLGASPREGSVHDDDAN
ncbi:MAG: hypothetical protein JWN86_1566 [Planctomycetota bacterium]|nr:hypothetical protein [Planctomycetota bacterium]